MGNRPDKHWDYRSMLPSPASSVRVDPPSPAHPPHHSQIQSFGIESLQGFTETSSRDFTSEGPEQSRFHHGHNGHHYQAQQISATTTSTSGEYPRWAGRRGGPNVQCRTRPSQSFEVSGILLRRISALWRLSLLSRAVDRFHSRTWRARLSPSLVLMYPI